MKTIKNKITKITAATLSLFVMAATSCQIGLGPSIDITAPLITVITPENTACIKGEISMRGMAEDNRGVTLIEVSVEETGQSFRLDTEKKVWEEKFVDDWYEMDAEKGNCGDNLKELSWNLTFDLNATSEDSGKSFTIVTKAYDEAKNSGKTQIDERSVTVDTNNPVVSIISPSTKKQAERNDLLTGYDLRDNNVLTYLKNGDLEISGSQEEDAYLANLVIYIDEGTKDFYKKDAVSETDLTNLCAKITIPESERIWNATIKANSFNFTPGTENTRHILRLITESHDKAQNIESKVQGYFIYDNNADVPWSEAKFGYETEEALNRDIEAKNPSATIYPASKLQGQSYDDDGIKTITKNVYKISGTHEELIEANSEVLNLKNEGYPKYKAWSVEALRESCTFKVEIICTDINNVSSTEIKYLSVSDVSAPEIIDITDTSSSLFGDINGNFYIEGSAEDYGINDLASLTLVYIHDDSIMHKYIDAGFSGWTTVTNGNKLYNLKDNSVNIAAVKTEQRDGKFIRNYKIKLNIFTDLGIEVGKTGYELSTQNFAILALDHGGQSSIQFINFIGDSQKPSLEIKELAVYTTSGSTSTLKESVDFSKITSTPTLSKYNTDNNGISDKIKISGTWSDNSMEKWLNKASAKRLLSTADFKKISNISLSWQDIENINVKMYSDGTWETDLFKPTDRSSVAFSASIKDIGGNETTQTECFNINITSPELTRITTDDSTPSGSYNKGKELTIVLEYNKNITVEGGTPTLTLTGNRTAIFDEHSNGSALHKFTYTVQEGDNVPLLNVIRVNANNLKYKDDSGEYIKFKHADGKMYDNTETSFTVANDRNLSASRTITLDTTAPSLTSLSAIAVKQNSYYSEGKEIFIKATFSEPVIFDESSKTLSKETVYLEFEDGTKSSAVVYSSDSLLFTYTVPSATEKQLKLKQYGLVIDPSLAPKDAALNSLEKIVLNTSTDLSSQKIYIDSIKPQTPEIKLQSGVTDGKTVYGSSFEFEITYKDLSSGTKNEYSIDDGVSWSTYFGKVTLDRNNTYKIKARQTDAAGNVSDVTDSVTVTLKTGNIFTSITSTNSNGTYTHLTGKNELTFVLNYTTNVTVDTSHVLILKGITGTNKTASYSSGNGTSSIYYTYTITEGHSADQVDVDITSLPTVTTDESEAISLNEDTYKVETGTTLIDSRNAIKIVTTGPVLGDITYNDTTKKLTLPYNTTIAKGTGSILLKMADSNYKIPTVLTVDQFNKYNTASTKDTDSADNLSTYYELGTIGTINDQPDLTEKYILKFSYNPDTVTADITKIKNLLIAAGASGVEIPITSTSVTFGSNGTDKTALVVDLNPETSAYYLPVKGADYTLTLGEGFVQNLYQITSNQITAASSKIVSSKVIETPVIRIEKTDETVNGSSIIQPLTANVVINCQTPGVNITKTVKYVTNAAHDPQNASNTPTKKVYSDQDATTVRANTIPNNTFKIGSSADDDRTKGMIYKITAQATKSGYTSSTTVTEYAYRTVYSVYNLEQINYATGYTQVYVRGGDRPTGGNSLSSFPISWNTKDFDKVRPMTNISGQDWYWVTWKISSKAYVDQVRGDKPSDFQTMGPKKWCWGMCGIMPVIKDMPLYAGNSLRVNGNFNFKYGEVSFYSKHREFRTQDGTVIKREMTAADAW